MTLSMSREIRRSLLALLPLAMVAGLAVAFAVAAYASLYAPAYDRVVEARVTHDKARQTQVSQHAMRETEEALKKIWQTLPPRTEFTSLILNISDLARRERVAIPGMTYTFQKVEEGLGLKASITFRAAGEYASIRRFIHQLETTGPHLFVESLDVSRSGGEPKTQNVPVNFNVRVVTFLRPESPSVGGI